MKRLKISLKREVTFGFILTFSILAVIGFASYKSITNLIQTQRWVSHTQEALHLSNQLLAEVEAAGSEQRLYIITGQEQFPKSYIHYERQIGQTLKALNILLQSNLTEQRQLIVLEPFIEERLKIADMLIGIRKIYGFRAAQKIIKTGRTDGITMMIRKYLGEVKKEQRNLLNRRIIAAEKSATTTISIIALGTALALIFLSAAAWIIYHDIDERQRLEEERARFFRLSIDLFCVVGFNGLFEQLNPAWEKTLGFSQEETLAKPFMNFVHPDDRKAAAEEIEKLSLGVNIMAFESRILCKDGSHKWLRWNAVASPSDQLIYASARDITDQKKIEKMKDEVIAMATHEMRNPLTAIHASLSVLIDEIDSNISPTSKKLISIAHQSSAHLIELVNDFLDIQKLEYGRMDFHIRTVDLAPLLRKAIELNQTYAQRLGVNLTIKEPVTEIKINADEGRFLQVMANLISNAAKYSPRGESVEVTATPLGQLVRVSISDHGPGIPENFKSRIFQKFSQADSGTKPGTGLGLSISKAIVEKLGGTIGFETQIGHGTIFYFDLPSLTDEKI